MVDLLTTIDACQVHMDVVSINFHIDESLVLVEEQ